MLDLLALSAQSNEDGVISENLQFVLKVISIQNCSFNIYKEQK